MTAKNAAKPTIEARNDAWVLLETAVLILENSQHGLTMGVDTKVTTLTRLAAHMSAVPHDVMFAAVTERAHANRLTAMRDFRRGTSQVLSEDSLPIATPFWDRVRRELRNG